MTSSLSLQVVLRIPVGIVNDDGVGCDKVDAETTGTSTQQEDESEKKKYRKKVQQIDESIICGGRLFYFCSCVSYISFSFLNT